VKNPGDSSGQGHAKWPALLVSFALVATLAWGAALCWLVVKLLLL
jgi:hypothetical protein